MAEIGMGEIGRGLPLYWIRRRVPLFGKRSVLSGAASVRSRVFAGEEEDGEEEGGEVKLHRGQRVRIRLPLSWGAKSV